MTNYFTHVRLTPGSRATRFCKNKTAAAARADNAVRAALQATMELSKLRPSKPAKAV